MPDYVANTQITVPLYVPGLEPDVDLNGLKFSYQHGIFYQPSANFLPIKLPPLMDGSR